MNPYPGENCIWTFIVTHKNYSTKKKFKARGQTEPEAINVVCFILFNVIVTVNYVGLNLVFGGGSWLHYNGDFKKKWCDGKMCVKIFVKLWSNRNRTNP